MWLLRGYAISKYVCDKSIALTRVITWCVNEFAGKGRYYKMFVLMLMIQ